MGLQPGYLRCRSAFGDAHVVSLQEGLQRVICMFLPQLLFHSSPDFVPHQSLHAHDCFAAFHDLTGSNPKNDIAEGGVQDSEQPVAKCTVKERL